MPARDLGLRYAVYGVAAVGAVLLLLYPGLIALYRVLGATLGAASVCLIVFTAVFFRDPERVIGEGIVSAADGRVQEVERTGDTWRVAVFMAPTDVHVNRFPVDARVESVEDSGSGFRPAYRPDARHNRQRRYTLSSEFGRFEVIQMTGVVARRLVSFVEPGDARKRGDRLGMIVAGSRVDVLFPAARLTPVVRVGDRILAGTSTIARTGVR